MLIILPSSFAQIEEMEHSSTDVNDISNLSHKLGCRHSIFTEKNGMQPTILNVCIRISIAADLVHISVRKQQKSKTWKTCGRVGYEKNNQ